MGRGNRRRQGHASVTGRPSAAADSAVGATTAASRPDDRRSGTEPEASQRPGGGISWRNVALGVVAGEALLLVLSNGGLLLSNLAFGSSDRADGGIVGVASFLAVIAGAYLASRRSGRLGIYQGIWVAVGFIAVGAITQYLHEQHIVQLSLQTGSHRLVDLGSMNLGGLFSGDLLALFGGTFGGWLGDGRSAQLGADRPAQGPARRSPR